MFSRSLFQCLASLLAVLVLITSCSPGGPVLPPPAGTVTLGAARPAGPSAAAAVTPQASLAATRSPTGTPIPSPGAPSGTPTPTPFPDLSGLSRVDRYQEALHLMIYPALEHIYNRRPDTARPYLDAAIAAVPDHAYLYYLRANLRYQLAEQANNAADAGRDLYDARMDINQAIAIGPASGDYYFLRAAVADRYRLLHGTGEPVGWDLELEARPVLADLQAAQQQGNLTQAQPERRALEIMIHLGYCQQAMDGLAALEDPGVLQQTAQPDDLDAGFHALAAAALACAGELDLALAHNYLAVQEEPSNYAHRYTYALLLTSLGRPNEALPVIQHYLAAYPGYRGPRLFLRALIYHDLGEFDKARQDLELGQTPAWGLDGMGALVSGLLARQAGQFEAGSRLLTQAANSLPVGEYTPLLRRARDNAGFTSGITPEPVNIPGELRQLPTPRPTADLALAGTVTQPSTRTVQASATHAASVTPRASITPMSSVTPLATITPASTVTPPNSVTPATVPEAIITVQLTPTATVAVTSTLVTPTRAAPTAATAPPARRRGFDPAFFSPSHELPVAYQGSGPFTLAPESVLELYVMPEAPLEFTQVLSVTFYLLPSQANPPQQQASGLLLGLFLRSNYETRHRTTRLEAVQWGENPYRSFAGYVDRLGGMHILLSNQSAQPVAVQEFGVQVTVRQPNGQSVVVGIQP